MAKPDKQATYTILPSSWDLVRPSYELVRQNIDTMLWLIIIPGVMSVLGNVLLNKIRQKYFDTLSSQPTPEQLSNALHHLTHDLVGTSMGQITCALLAASFLWNLIVFPATITFMLRASRGKPADVASCLREGISKFWRIYGVSLAVFLVIAGGIIIFIVPGFIALRRYIMAPFYLVDRDCSIVEALRASAREGLAYKNYIWGTIGVFVAFGVMASVLNTIPYIGFIIGLAASYIYYFGLVLRYQTIMAANTSDSAAPKK